MKISNILYLSLLITLVGIMLLTVTVIGNVNASRWNVADRECEGKGGEIVNYHGTFSCLKKPIIVVDLKNSI